MEMVQRKLGIVQVLMIVAALITAAIHLYLGLKFGDTLFLLNAIGFVGLLGLYLIPLKLLVPFRGYVRWLLVAYSLVTIIMWAILNGKLDVTGIAAKGSEVALIILLIVDRKS
ncbi:MAG: hypothetical protein HY835_10255 [Anaerolineae bacterium]|nr:hypothetical protein [Anaerolineae bacterium]